MDQTSCQNTPNVTRVAYDPSISNKQIKSPYRFKINATGIQAINGNSYLHFHEKSNSMDFIRAITGFRLINTENTELITTLLSIINNENTTDEKLEEILENKTTKEEIINNIINKLDTDKDSQEMLKQVKNVCNKQDTKNPKRITHLRYKQVEENFKNKKLRKLLRKEKRIILILDNCRIHHSKIVKKVAKFLKITLMYLPPYSPDFNPIEDVWRVVKRKVYSSIYKNLTELKEIFTIEYFKNVDKESFYTKWVDNYLKLKT